MRQKSSVEYSVNNIYRNRYLHDRVFCLRQFSHDGPEQEEEETMAETVRCCLSLGFARVVCMRAGGRSVLGAQLRS